MDSFELDTEPIALAAVSGFRTGIASCGIKSAGPDVGVLYCEDPRGCGSAVFTRNEVAAAPVRVSRPRAAAGGLRAAVVNSGNANCCTGARGDSDAREMSAIAARLLGTSEEQVLVASTGIIGRPMPMETVRRGVEAACAQALSDGNGDLASAILTTDTRRKAASARGRISGRPFRVAGIAKGAGMIAPDMATMLAFVVTDATVSRSCLGRVLALAASRTFNRVTVDGDTSTNDTLCLLSSCRAANPVIEDESSPAGSVFAAAVEAVCKALAVAIAADGEGATRLVEVRVSGAASPRDAELAARAVAQSLLVKTAIHGADPNWGRILAAAGRSGARVDDSRATVRLAGVRVFDAGRPAPSLPPDMRERLSRSPVLVELELGLGEGSAEMWTCDLSAKYVEINAHYHT